MGVGNNITTIRRVRSNRRHLLDITLGGGGGKPAAMLARLEREQEMAKKKVAKSSVSDADIAGQQPQETSQQLPFPSIPSNKNLSVSGGGISGDAKKSTCAAEERSDGGNYKTFAKARQK